MTSWADEARRFVHVAGRAFAALVSGRAERESVARQMFQIGNRSLVFVAATLGFLGMVLVFQTCLQVSRITGDLSQVGAEFAKVLVHEFGPSLTALMLATRVGAGIAAEVGTMVVTEQVDALRMNGVDPIDYLIAPRLGASLVMTGALTVFGVAVALAAGAATAGVGFHVNPRIFFDLGRVHWGDAATGAMKVVAYGAAIPIVSGWAGLGARGGSEGVGVATTRAVIASSFVVILLDFVLSGVGLFVFQGGGAS